MNNAFLQKLATLTQPVLGVVMSAPHKPPAVRVKFASAADVEACAANVRKAFCECYNLKPEQLSITQNLAEATIEIKA